jgi:hypothetical protein
MSENTSDVRTDRHRFLDLEEYIADVVLAVELGMLAIEDETTGVLRFGFEQVKERAAALSKKYEALANE